MFSGIIVSMGKVHKIRNLGTFVELAISYSKGRKFTAVKVGDSIAINGACLTVTKKIKNIIYFDIMLETLKKTTFGEMKEGDLVNIEYSLRLNDLVGGHLVSGHIDTTAEVTDIQEVLNSWYVEYEVPKEFEQLLLYKGSIAVEGVSLTIAEVKGNRFKVGLIPFTLENTNLSQKKVGSKVNVEFDLIGKWIRNFVSEEGIFNRFLEYMKAYSNLHSK